MSYPALFIDKTNRDEYARRLVEIALQNDMTSMKADGIAFGRRLRLHSRAGKRLSGAISLAREKYACAELTRDMTGLRKAVPYGDYRLQFAYQVATRYRAGSEDVILALLGAATRSMKMVSHIRRATDAELDEHLGENSAGLFEKLENRPFSDEELNTAILDICRTKAMTVIRRTLTQHRSELGIPVVQDAYELACHTYEGELNTLQVPRVLHSLFMAQTLAAHHFDCDVVAAALLHDLPMHAGQHREQVLQNIEGRTNARVCAYVKAFTVMEDVRKSASNADGALMDVYEQLRHLMGKSNDYVFALYIKGADLLHRLAALDDEKADAPAVSEGLVRAASQVYLKLFEEYALNHFATLLRSACGRFTNPERYYKILNDYTTLLDSCDAQLHGYDYTKVDKDFGARARGFHEDLKDHIRYLNTPANVGRVLPDHAVYEDIEYAILPYTVCEIDEQLAAAGAGNSADPSQLVISKRNVNLQKMYVILKADKPNQGAEAFFRLFVRYYTQILGARGYVILNMYHDKRYDQFHVTVEDALYDRIDVIITVKQRFLESMYGAAMAYKAETAPEPREQDTQRKIRVFKPNGNVVYLDPGATALDFAYYVHAELCVQACEAIVNTHRCRLDTRLNDNDRVFICKFHGETPDISTGKPTEPVIHANVRYLHYTKNLEVQRYIINYLSRRMYGDEVLYETVVSNDAYEAHMNNMYALNTHLQSWVEKEDES